MADWKKEIDRDWKYRGGIDEIERERERERSTVEKMSKDIETRNHSEEDKEP